MTAIFNAIGFGCTILTISAALMIFVGWPIQDFVEAIHGGDPDPQT